MAKQAVRNKSQIKRRAIATVRTQRKINNDYKILAKDYGILFKRLWEIPVTKYVVGGAVVAALVPFTKRLMENYPEIKEFLRENLSHAEEKLEEVTDEISSKFSNLKHGKIDKSEMSH